MSITASQVNNLRQKTGAGMMDCKKALVEANGDEQAAIDILRKKGQKVASKRGDNETNEGLVIAKPFNGGKSGVIVALACETDFVAKNESYYQFVDKLADLAAASKPSSVEEFMKVKFENDLTVEDKITEQVGVIGEKLVITEFDVFDADAVVEYNHPGNQVAAIVGINKASEASIDAAKQVAMQVAAMAPIALNKEGVDQDTINRELEIGKELAIQEGKPADMAAKIAEGRLSKFFKESTLLSQPFVRDNKLSVEQFLNATENGLTVVKFKRISLK